MSDYMSGSDSPHVADALASLTGSTPLPKGAAAAITHGLLAIAEELAEARRQQHSDAIDVANAIATLTGVVEQPERVYMATRMTWWGHLRALFGGAR